MVRLRAKLVSCAIGWLEDPLSIVDRCRIGFGETLLAQPVVSVHLVAMAFCAHVNVTGSSKVKQSVGCGLPLCEGLALENVIVATVCAVLLSLVGVWSLVT